MERLAGRVILLWGWKRALVAMAAGAVASLAQAPFDFPAAAFVGFPVLVWLLDGATAHADARGLRRLGPAFGTGWCFGFGYFVAGIWWTGNALLVEADLFAWALPLAILGLPALLAIFYGLATAIARLLWSDDIGRIAALALGFAIAEWLRATVLTGFPWNAVGYAAMPVPLLMQSVAAIGQTGMNALAVFVFALPALLAGRRHLRLGLALGLALVALHAGYGALRLAAADQWPVDHLAIRIVQPSIEQVRKWDTAERDRIFQTHLDLTTQPPAQDDFVPDVVLWPETALPFLIRDRPDALVALGEAIGEDQLLLAGIVRAESAAGGGATRYYNSIVVIDDGGEIVDAFDKVHLVPFGEYLPFQSLFARIGLRPLVENVGGFSAGTSRRPLSLRDGIQALPFICYEIIFPGVAERGTQARLLVNLTNDAWFGATPGPYQHFRQAQLRAVEAGLPLARAANNGLSAVVDGHGRVLDGLALDAVGVLDIELPLVRADRYLPPLAPGHAGLIVVLVLAFAAGASNLWARRRVN